MKAYHEVCIDIIKMLEDIEESLQEIGKESPPVEENNPDVSKEKTELSWLERHFDFIKPAN